MNTQERPHIYNHNTGGPWGSWPKSVNTLGEYHDLIKETELPSLQHLGGAAEAAIMQTTSFQNGIQVQLCCDDPPALSLLQEHVSSS